MIGGFKHGADYVTKPYTRALIYYRRCLTSLWTHYGTDRSDDQEVEVPFPEISGIGPRTASNPGDRDSGPLQTSTLRVTT